MSDGDPLTDLTYGRQVGLLANQSPTMEPIVGADHER